MRTLTDHKVNGLNEALTITAMADPIHAGGACNHYMVTLADWTRNPDGSESHHVWDFNFQSKPISDSLDFNGLTNEVLIAIVMDRLRSFQSGTFKCKENACALTHLEEGLMWLQQRTRMRIASGVEGKLAPIPPQVFSSGTSASKFGSSSSDAAGVKASPVIDPPASHSEVAVDFTDPKLREELSRGRPQTPARQADTPQS